MLGQVMDSGQVVASACVFHVRPIGVGFAWPHPYFAQKTKRTNRFENYNRLSLLQTFFHRSSTCVSPKTLSLFLWIRQAWCVPMSWSLVRCRRHARNRATYFFIAQFLTCWVFLIPQMAVVILTSNGRLWRHCAVARGGHCKVPCLGAMVRCHFPNSFMVFGVYAGVIFLDFQNFSGMVLQWNVLSKRFGFWNGGVDFAAFASWALRRYLYFYHVLQCNFIGFMGDAPLNANVFAFMKRAT